MITRNIARGLLFAVAFAAGDAAFAQSVSSAVGGTATDLTGAAIPGASVKLSNRNTGGMQRGTTDGAGNYSFPSVPLGFYDLTVEKPGFATYKLTNFNVVVGQRATEDVKLAVASSAQEVTVNGGALADLLQPESNDLGTVIGTQTVAQIPLNGRNFLQLGFLAGGVTFPSGEAASTINQTGNNTQTGNRITAINVAGNEPDFTMYLVNGIQTIGTRAGNSSLNLSVSAVDQFEVHYGFFMPDLGPNPAIVDVITKAGTNKFHGEAFEFFRNTALIAKDYFAGAPAPYHQNQFGGAIGGPVLKDKLFFFFNYEGYRETLALTSNLLVPTPALASGDFSAAGYNIYNPFNVVNGQRQQFSYQGRLNVIDPALINKSSAAALAYYATSTLPVVNGSNYHVRPKFIQNTDQYTGRFDYNLNAKNNFFFQGTYLTSPETSPGAFLDQGTQFPLDTEYGAVGWTLTYGANKVNEARIGWTRNSVFSKGFADPGVQAALGITGTPDTGGLPNINITGLSGFGAGSGLLGDVDNSYQIHDAFNWLLGKHQLKFGADIAYVRTVDSSANISARGGINFQNQFTTQLNCTPPACTPGGSAFADYLIGTPAGGEAKGMPLTHYRYTTASPYIQDTWKITPKLTANLALAWYGSTPPNPAGSNKNFIHGFDFNSGLLTFAALGQMNPEVYPMTKTNFAPRVGFSYQAGPKTVIRGGFGLYYTTQELVNVQYSVVSQFITVDNTFSNTGLTVPKFIFGQNLFPPQGATVGVITQAQANSITAPLQYLSQTQRAPYIYQYNLDVEHAFGPYLIDIAYIGNEAHRLPFNYNPFDCSAADFTCVNSRIPYGQKYPYAQEVDSIGYSNYSGLIAKFQRQFTNGLSFLGSYTYSKSLSNAQEGGNTTNNQMKSCFQCDYGLATYNVPQAVNVGAVWDIPFGRDRKYGSNVNKAVDLVGGGWNLDVIASFQQGTPFNFSEPDHTLWPADNTRPNRVCNGRNELMNKDTRNNGHYWFQTSCFAPSYTSSSDVLHAFGNTGFDPLTGPGIDNWDLSVHKDFTIYEQVKFGLRGEFFNAFNHTDFANPDAGVADANFGKITATQHLPRVIQVAGKITF